MHNIECDVNSNGVWSFDIGKISEYDQIAYKMWRKNKREILQDFLSKRQSV